MYPATIVSGTQLFYRAIQNTSMPAVAPFTVSGGLQEINITFNPAPTGVNTIKFVVTNTPCIESNIAIFTNMPTVSSSVAEMGGNTINCMIVFTNDTLFTPGAVLFFGAANNLTATVMKQFSVLGGE
jgi:hypothetical protein